MVLGANRIIMTGTFGIWALFFSEPFSELQLHDLCEGNLTAYQRLRWYLKITRILFYFMPTFVLLGIVYILYK